MTSDTARPEGELREAVARVIDPWAHERAECDPETEQALSNSYVIADAILALVDARPQWEPVGWQYRLSQEVADRADAHAIKTGKAPLGRRWVFDLCVTREEAERAAYGGSEGRPLNEVRPVYALSHQGKPSS